jgi:hypothetical protein
VTPKAPAEDDFVIEPSVPADDPELRRLLREAPMQGEIRLSLEREPNAGLAAAIEGDRHVTWVARHGGTGQIVGMASRAVRDIWLNGKPARLGYLGQLRVEPGRLRLGRLMRAFAVVEEVRRSDELPFDLTSILAGNRVARRLFERGLPGLPRYQRLCEFVTLLIPPRRLRRGVAGGVRPASPGDLPAIAECLQRNLRRYQFAPIWTEENLRSPTRTRDLHAEHFHVATAGDQIVGCVARWNQRGFKQVVVRGYSQRLSFWRPVLNLGLTLFGRPKLPAPGSPLRLVYLSHLAVDGDRQDRALDLIDAARHDAAGTDTDYLVAGLVEGHPLLPLLQRRYPAHTLRAVLYLVVPPEAEASLAAIDERLPHFEVATF